MKGSAFSDKLILRKQTPESVPKQLLEFCAIEHVNAQDCVSIVVQLLILSCNPHVRCLVWLKKVEPQLRLQIDQELHCEQDEQSNKLVVEVIDLVDVVELLVGHEPALQVVISSLEPLHDGSKF